MSLCQILRGKRKECGLTQEQVADYLGVSAPAVSKWESGASCPDLSLIAPLARLLNTDPNTLLSFKEELSEQEIASVLLEISDCARTQGYAKAFSVALGKIREYPNCMPLLEHAAVTLEGLLMMSGIAKEERETYTDRLTCLYEQAAAGNDPDIQQRAIFMLIPKYIARKEFEKAQTLIDRLSVPSELDRRQAQANLFLAEEKYTDAAMIYERSVLSSANKLLGALLQLSDIACKENRVEDANAIADLHGKLTELLGLWEYNTHLAPLQLALSSRDADLCLTQIKALLDASLTPWNMANSPLFFHMTANAPEGQQESQSDYGKRILPGLLASFEQNAQCDFLRQNEDFQKLLEHYKKKCYRTSCARRTGSLETYLDIYGISK